MPWPILELCDGSRTRDRVVMDAILRSSGAMRAADVGRVPRRGPVARMAH